MRLITMGKDFKAVIPKFIKLAAGMNASKGQDILSALAAPKHAGLFTSGANDGFATGLNDPGANKEVLSAEGAILHAADVVEEI